MSVLSGGQGQCLHFKWKPWWNSNGMYRQMWTVQRARQDTRFIEFTQLVVFSTPLQKFGDHHSLLQTQNSKDKQLFNYLCIIILINRLKKALSPWQPTSHSLYHQLSLRLPAWATPMVLARQGEKNEGGWVSYCYIICSSFHIPDIPPLPLLLTFSL